MRNINDKPSFDPDKPLIVARRFDAGGKTFEMDQAFDWRRMKMPQDAVVNLYNTDYLRHGTPQIKRKPPERVAQE